MKVLLAFVIGALLAFVVVWVMSDPHARHEVEELGQDIGDGVDKAGEGIRDAVQDVDTAEIKRDVKEAGQKVVVTTKEFVSDASITGSIKTKLVSSDEVSALGIDVDTTDGVVTLSGKVESQEEIQEAVAIASSVKGVRQVISTLQVDQEPVAAPPPKT